MVLSYTFTNESLEGIMKGLAIGPKDSVLAVGGSGDQAFAMLEFARKVVAVDSSRSQIEFIYERIEALEDRDQEGFFLIEGEGAYDGFINGNYDYDLLTEKKDERRKYFLEDVLMLQRIKKRLGNLVVKESDIFDFAQKQKGFSKVYLSNATAYDPRYSDPRKTLRMASTNLPKGGLIYVADENLIRGTPPELKKDEKLTKKAREFDGGIWAPAVYRKIA